MSNPRSMCALWAPGREPDHVISEETTLSLSKKSLLGLDQKGEEGLVLFIGYAMNAGLDDPSFCDAEMGVHLYERFEFPLPFGCLQQGKRRRMGGWRSRA